MIINIQFLRAWAALAVVFFHVQGHVSALEGVTGLFYDFLFQFGYAGVDVFFVISGYVIWISSQNKQINNTNKPPAHFIFNRAARIYLGYWPYFLLALLMYLILAPQILEGIDLLGSALLTKYHIPQLLIKVTWTLIFEMYFYVYFACLLIFPRRYLPKLLLFSALFIVVVQLYSIIQNDIYDPENLNYMGYFLAFFTSPLCLQFLAGCGIGIFFEQHRLKYLKTASIFAVTVFAFTLWYQQTYLLPSHLLSQGYFMPERAVFFGMFAVLLVCIAVECEKRGRQWWPKFSKLLGGASYSLYLAHLPLLFLASYFGLFALSSQNDWLWLMSWLVVTGIIIYSIIHYLWIEKPLMNLAKKLEIRLFRKPDTNH